MCACQKSYTSIIMTSITWAGPTCVQEAAAILGPQNRTQGRCVLYNHEEGSTRAFSYLKAPTNALNFKQLTGCVEDEGL